MKRHYALALLVGVYTSNFLDRTILQTVLEPIKLEWGLSDSELGFLSGFTFAIFYASLGMPIAWMADRSNRRNIVAGAVAIWSVMTVACGFSQSYWQLLIARIGVGIGEAGGTPPSHSIIADLYPAERRATAMAIYSLGVPIGMLLGFLIGGLVAGAYGWRAAFMVVGGPGLIIAALVRFTLKEPIRGKSDPDVLHVDAPTLREAIRIFLDRPALTHLTLGSTMSACAGYGLLIWLSSFLARSHHMGIVERSTYLALSLGLGGVIGNAVTGYLADRLGHRDIRWKTWIVVIGTIIVQPVLIAGLLIDDTTTALVVILIPTLAGSLYLGPTWALLADLVGLRMRALASAFLLFILNLISLGIGPTLIGVISEALTPAYGADSLRYALFVAPVFSLWSAVHYYLVGRTLKRDLAASRGTDLTI